jgi:hypothetical protein
MPINMNEEWELGFAIPSIIDRMPRARRMRAPVRRDVATMV